MTNNFGLLLFCGILLSILVTTGGQWGPPEFDFGGPGPGFGGMGFGGPGFGGPGFGRPPPWVRRAWRRRFCFRHPDHPRCWGMPPPDFGAPPPPPPGWGMEEPWGPEPQAPQAAPQPQPAPMPAPAPPPPRPIPAPAPPPPIRRPPPPPPPPRRAPAPAPPPRPPPPPIPSPPLTAVPRGPPAPLARFVRDIKFGRLDPAPRQALINTCTSRRINCRQQLSSAAQKRSNILASELSIQRKLNPRLPNGLIEGRLNRVQQVKQQLLATSGLGTNIIPQNDGTFEEDVLLTDTQSTGLLNSLRSRRRKRSGVYAEGFPTQIWPKRRPIPYAFDVSLLPANQIVVRNALREIETKTCIRFQYFSRRPSQNHIYYTKISSSTFCGLSYVGRVSPANPIYLSFSCPDFTGVVIHETLHALGVIHQHLRSDRDESVRMEWSNINPLFYDHFAIADAKMFTTYGVPYDYYSIMHYKAYAAAIDPNRPTMTPLSQTARFLPILGQRQKLSDRDIELLNAMYCTSDSCIDRNVFCGVWALKRLCNSRDNGGWLKQNCQKSCGFCK